MSTSAPVTRLPKVTYGRLTRQARDTIRWQLWRLDGPVATIADYIRHYSGGTGEWGGDACGCVDDRCIGYHHEGSDDCQCIQVLVDEFVAEMPAQ